MTTKERLHLLVESLPDHELAVAQRFLEFLGASNTQDRVLRAFLDAPYDDEPLTPEEAASIDEAHEEVARSEAEPWESVRAELFGRR